MKRYNLSSLKGGVEAIVTIILIVSYIICIGCNSNSNKDSKFASEEFLKLLLSNKHKDAYNVTSSITKDNISYDEYQKVVRNLEQLLEKYSSNYEYTGVKKGTDSQWGDYFSHCYEFSSNNDTGKMLVYIDFLKSDTNNVLGLRYISD